MARRGERVVGAVPLYQKSHSAGEYMFDYSWAEVYAQVFGGGYYPKLQAAVPFTPVPGPRLLTDSSAVRTALAAALVELCRRSRLSGVHVTFCTPEDREALEAQGFLARRGLQYHWHNRGYRDFDDFLNSLTSRRRKVIRRERREAHRHGLRLQALTGADLTESVWDALYRCYLETSSRKWGRPYLNREFFSLLGERLADRTVVMTAARGGRILAAAWNLRGSSALFGRNWGCLEDFPFLHFELCYYMAIDYAIAEGLSRVEAGAQGEHKIQRGYLPTPTHGAVWFRRPEFSGLMAAHLASERAIADQDREYLDTVSPFRRVS